MTAFLKDVFFNKFLLDIFMLRHTKAYIHLSIYLSIYLSISICIYITYIYIYIYIYIYNYVSKKRKEKNFFCQLYIWYLVINILNVTCLLSPQCLCEISFTWIHDKHHVIMHIISSPRDIVVITGRARCFYAFLS